MDIRLATADDKARWLPLWQAYLTFYQHALTDEVTDLTWARFLDPDEPMRLYLAWEDGRVLGFAALVVHRSTWARSHYVYLEDLFVDAAARGKGAGRALIKAVVDDGRAIGAERVYWVTHSHNATARSLYDQVADLPGLVTYTARM